MFLKHEKYLMKRVALTLRSTGSGTIVAVEI